MFDVDEVSLNLVKPSRICGREVQMEMRMIRQQHADDTRPFYRDVIGYSVHGPPLRQVSSDIRQEGSELG